MIASRHDKLIIGGLWFALMMNSSLGAVIVVHPGTLIQGAISTAQSGDVIRIDGGTYNEHLVIDKTLTLEGLHHPVVSGQFTGDVIRVRAVDVHISGLVLRDSGTDLGAQNAGIYVQPGADRVIIKDCFLAFNLFGIWLEKSNDSQIIHTAISGRRDLLSVSRGNGIQVFSTKNALIAENNISFSRDGIYVDVSTHATFRHNKIHHVRYGTHYMTTNFSTWEDNEVYLNRGGLALMEVRNLIVRNNRVYNNADHGIMLRTIQDSVIEKNVVAGNDRGFFIYDAEYNVVRHNLVINNHVGVHLSAGSSNNAINGNVFINNEEQVKFVAARDTEGGKTEANYWSNYSGWDQNGDGFGDVPYEANDIVDRLNWQYPLLKLLTTSPSIKTLRFVAHQFPVLRAPSIVEQHPRMHPINANWSHWNDK